MARTKKTADGATPEQENQVPEQETQEKEASTAEQAEAQPKEETSTATENESEAEASTSQTKTPPSEEEKKPTASRAKPEKKPKPAKKAAPKKKTPAPLNAKQREQARQIVNLSRNKTDKNILDQRPVPSRMHTVMSLILCFALIGVAYLAYTTPIFSTPTVSLLPQTLMESLSISDLNLGSMPELMLSYYICKYFYLVYLGVLGVAAFFGMLITLVRSSTMHKQTNAVMYGVLTMLLIATLLGFNYINIVKTIDPNLEITTSQFVFFILGMLVMLAKFFLDIIFGKRLVEHELKTSSVSILTSFTQSFLTLAALFFPLYIFPGVGSRMRGIDLILGNKTDVFDFLPMTAFYKNMLTIFAIVTAGCMAVNMFLYLSSKKFFLHFNRFSHLFSLFSLIIYALMGVNYMLCYVDAKAYNEIFTIAMNTYSYVPIGLLILFWLGCGFTNLALARVNVQYRIYATPNEEDEEKNKKEKKEEKIPEDSPLSPFTGGPKDPLRVALEEKEKHDDSVPDPVPAFSELDRKTPQFEAKYQTRVAKTFQDITLPALVHHVIEYAKYSRERLSYGPVEVKTFLAGIAASRLSILQGMSGTGKTSLPKIFMESIDGVCEIVAVESSWRDKNELLGYYNEFNKKYTPKSFTQFIYKASLNKEVPTFIVLDEMNLSRIEYYFSDFLSLMEAREHLRFIKLFDVQLFPRIDERTEYLSLRDGHTIDIPTNVWFIGTANRDESTFEISDKVYDRAQTMNFDKRASKVNVTEEVDYPQKFVSYSTLRRLFDATKSIKFDAESYDAIKKVEQLLRPYKISFGNRVLKQIEEFVKAYVGCSEITNDADREKFTHEAVDCIIFSKVVRKLELKQITDIDTLIEGFTAARLPKCLEFVQTLIDAT